MFLQSTIISFQNYLENKYSCSGLPAFKSPSCRVRFSELFHKNFFWKKLLTSISSTYWPLSFCKFKKKKILRANPELWGCVIFRPKIAQFVLNKFFLVQIIIFTFIYLLALFTGQNFKQILTMNPELWGCIIFGPKMVHLPQTKKFFEKNH